MPFISKVEGEFEEEEPFEIEKATLFEGIQKKIKIDPFWIKVSTITILILIFIIFILLIVLVTCLIVYSYNYVPSTMFMVFFLINERNYVEKEDFLNVI
jgi:hypothetical protein